MIKRGGVALAVIALAGAACGHPEKSVVDQYFNAVNAKDTQTLSSFSAVPFDKKVDRWTIKETIAEDKKPAPLAELAQKAKDADAAVTANKKAASAYALDHYGEIDQVKEERDPWCKQWEFHYDLRPIINGVKVYVETRLHPEALGSRQDPVIYVVQIKRA